jgi:hypothetical protein
MIKKKHNPVVKYGVIGVVLILIGVVVLLSSSIMMGPDNPPPPPTSSACSISTGYICNNVTITNSGLLNFTFIQDTGQSEYNVTLYFTTVGLSTTNSNYTTSIYLGSELASGQPVKISVPLKPDMLNHNHDTNYEGWVNLSYSNTKNNTPNVSILAVRIVAFS